MSETRLWKWLGGVLPPGHYSRIESGDTAPGYPDVAYKLPWNIGGTLELKFARDPKAKIPFSNKHGIRKSQRIWIRDELRMGGIVWIIAEVTPEIFIIHGQFAAEINGSPLDELRKMIRATIHKDDPLRAAKQLEEILRDTTP